MAQAFVQKISEWYPNLRFGRGKKFAFRPPKTIVYEEKRAGLSLNEYKLSFLHELGHALLEHRDFRTDAERIKMERAAWERARELCAECGVDYEEEWVEDNLDTYRDWLHQKSLCPECGLTRYQTMDGKYHCSFCDEYKR